MSRFTERLWNELLRGHGAELAQMKRPATHTLVLPTVRVGDQIRIAKVRSVRGLAPACLALARPPLPVSAGQGGAVQCHASAVAVAALAAGRPGAIKKALAPEIKKALARVRSVMRRIKEQGGAATVKIRDGGKLAQVIKRNAPLPVPAEIAQCREIAAPVSGRGGRSGKR